MGQQQLLLIVLGVIIVGIAIVVGINLFNANAVTSNRDGLTSDLQNLAAMAHQYYVKPKAMGGGGNDYTGIDATWLTNTGLGSNANGTYSVVGTSDATGCEFEGLGKQTGTDGANPVKMDIFVKVPPLTDSLVTKN